MSFVRKSIGLGLLTAACLVSQASQAAIIDYNLGKGLSVESGDGNNKVAISGLLQARFYYLGRENNLADVDRFEIPRAKIKLYGHVLSPKLKYELQMVFGTKANAGTASVLNPNNGNTTVLTSETTSGLATIEEAYGDWTPYPYFGIRFGQFKVPYLKQQLTSSSAQQFVDRPGPASDFDHKFDMGASVHGVLGDSFKANYDVFVMNGAGTNKFNVNQDLMMGTRVEFPILGKYESVESDVNDSQEPQFGIGLAYLYTDHDANFAANNVLAGTKASHGTLDLGLKYKGWSFQGAGMAIRTHTGGNVTHFGYLAEAGYFFIPKTLELAVRTDSAIYSGATANKYEYAVGFNYFIKGHPIKLQTDYAFLLNNGAFNQDDHQIRTQLQIQI